MANELALFKDLPALPADVASFFEEESNIAPKATVPSLGYEGKVWSISLNGEKTRLQKKNEDGDLVPIPVMRVVVLGYNARRGRAYYEGAYDPAKPGLPLCYSDDGSNAAPRVKKVAEESGEPLFKGWTGKCEGCPMSVKGSKISDNGKATKACGEHRMLVVVPANNLEFEPLRLKLAMTSDYDGQSPDNEAQGWFAFSNLMDMLRARGVKHSAELVIKMKFDGNVAYPKVLFSHDRRLEADEVRKIIPLVRGEKVKALLDGTFTPDGANGTKAETPMEKVLDKAVERKAAEKAGPSAEEVAAKAAAAAAAEKAAAKAAKIKAAEEAAAAAAAAAKAAAEDDDDDAEIVLPGTAAAAASEAAKPVAAKAEKPKAAKADKAPAVSTALPGDVGKLLTEWTDDE